MMDKTTAATVKFEDLVEVTTGAVLRALEAQRLSSPGTDLRIPSPIHGPIIWGFIWSPGPLGSGPLPVPEPLAREKKA